MSILSTFGFVTPLYAAEVATPEVRLLDSDIIVSSRLFLDEQQAQEVSGGVAKEIIFYVDLFRVWSNWPDEFVVGRTLNRKVKCDPVKKEYTGVSFDGSTVIKRRFSDCKPLVEWALSVTDMKLTNVKELEGGQYFVRVTAESRAVKLPAMISFLLFFVPEKEFSVFKNSRAFQINQPAQPGDHR